MKRRVLIALPLSVLSIIGIIIFQALWINSSYQVEQKQLIDELNQVLERSVDLYLLKKNDQIPEQLNIKAPFECLEIEEFLTLDSIKSMLDGKNGLPLPFSGSFPIKSGKGDIYIPQWQGGVCSEINLPVGQLSQLNINSPVDFKQVDSIMQHVMDSLIHIDLASTLPFDLPLIDSILQNELNLRSINSSFEIEKLEIEQLPENGEFLLNKTGEGIYTHFVPIGYLSPYHIRVKIATPGRLIFKRMGQLLIVSFIIVAFVFVSLLYIYKTVVKQKKLSDIKTDFINNITHELKTPIATVLASNEAILRFNIIENPKKTIEYIETSSKELERLSDLIERILNISAFEKNEYNLTPEEFEVKETINSIIKTHKGSTSKEVCFITEIQPHTLRICVDRVHFSNMLNNLVENAIKYSGQKITIRITIKNIDNMCLISIEDNGIGIAKQHIDKIFENFYRIPTGNTHNIKGFGLGLSYVWKIVNQQGGTIKVKSSLGKGTTFEIKIPVCLWVKK
jgi:two-component system phosphate regulon sensor histidine kinase PhoR